MTFSNTILALAVVTTALSAGLFYAYSCSVNPGLGRLPDAQYLAAMQSINRAIQNPVFFMSFMGTLILLPLAAWLSHKNLSPHFVWLAAAALIYAVGTFGITAFGNVPLNNLLDSVDLSQASSEKLHELRLAFEVPWNRLHLVRTLANVLALILAIVACLMHSPSPATGIRG